MNKQIITLALLIAAANLHAKTSIYGEANARVQFVNSQAGSALIVDGNMSEFGYKGEQAISEQSQANFNILLGVDTLGDWGPNIKQGSVSVTGNYGEIAAFYDLSPVAATGHYYQVMKNDPDSRFLLLNGSAVNSPKGVGNVDGLSYRSPLIEEQFTLQAALVPAEAVSGSTGVSFLGRYDQGPLDISLGFEVNVEQAQSQLFRVIGEYQTGNLKLGGHVQMSSNSDTDYSSRSLAGFLKLPIQFAQRETNNRIMMGFNTETDPADNAINQLYISFLQEIPWNDKVSSYSFVEVLMDNDLDDTTMWGGGGLKIGF
ncbi:hypothetical protein [Reinekea sp.]|jgi:hypothetical protein|uniref:hypothetical protein n=1 Tax=Reinekea sp. TaxID=1970455 RepID=UPI003989E29B